MRAFVGFGIGYSWNNWLRFDFTGEYRADVKFKVVGSYTEFCAGGRCFDVYDGDHQASVFLANAYLDLGHLVVPDAVRRRRCRRAYHKISALTDVGLGLASGGTAARSAMRTRTTRSGTSPGRCMPALPTTSPTTSRSSSPTAT